MIKIRVKVEERKTKDGRLFKIYRAVQTNGKLIDLRFRKEVTNLPVNDSFIYVTKDNINLQTNLQYPRYWVKKVEKIEPIIYTQTTSDLPFEVVEEEI